MSQKANRQSWKIDESKHTLVDLVIEQEKFTIDEMEKIKLGLIPKSMDDRWFVFFEENKLFIYRSWSGKLIYVCKFSEDSQSPQLISGQLNIEAFEDTTLVNMIEESEKMEFVIKRIMLSQEFETQRTQALKNRLSKYINEKNKK